MHVPSTLNLPILRQLVLRPRTLGKCKSNLLAAKEGAVIGDAGDGESNFFRIGRESQSTGRRIISIAGYGRYGVIRHHHRVTAEGQINSRIFRLDGISKVDVNIGRIARASLRNRGLRLGKFHPPTLCRVDDSKLPAQRYLYASPTSRLKHVRLFAFSLGYMIVNLVDVSVIGEIIVFLDGKTGQVQYNIGRERVCDRTFL